MSQQDIDLAAAIAELNAEDAANRAKLVALAGTVASGVALTKTITQTAHGFTVGNVIRYTGTAYAKSKADSASTADVLGVVSTVTDANTFIVTLDGYIPSGLQSLVAGSVYYLSAATAGLLTATEPSGLNFVTKPVLIADSTTSGFVQNQRGIVESGATALPVIITNPATAITVVEDAAAVTLTSRFNGLTLVAVEATLTTVSSSGLPTIGIRKNAATEMLSTALTIDANELGSATAATAAVINGANAGVVTGDTIHIDVDVAGTGAKGLFVELTFA